MGLIIGVDEAGYGPNLGPLAVCATAWRIPSELNSDLIGFIFSDKKTNEVKMLFDKNSLELKGWETNDAYSNKVNFEISNLIINNQIVDDFFKIPQEKDL